MPINIKLSPLKKKLKFKHTSKKPRDKYLSESFTLKIKITNPERANLTKHIIRLRIIKYHPHINFESSKDKFIDIPYSNANMQIELKFTATTKARPDNGASSYFVFNSYLLNTRARSKFVKIEKIF